MRPSKNFFVFISLFLAVCFTACKKDDQPQLRFVVVSDIHFSRNANAAEFVPIALKNLLQRKPLPDALFVCGDFTENGWPDEYDFAMEIFNNRSIIPEEVKVYLMTGNHEFREIRYVEGVQEVEGCTPDKQKNFRFEQMSSIERFTAKTGQPPHQYIDIKGYPFITISLTAGDNLLGTMPHIDVNYHFYDDNAMRFLTEKMADAAQKYRGKPIFLFSHVGSENTCVGTFFPIDGGGQNQFHTVLNGYPQTVFFSGHSHAPIGDPQTIHQEHYTSVNDGCLLPSSSKIGMEGLIVNVQKDGRVEIERWDAYRNEEILPRFQLEAPFDGSNFTYANRDGRPAPVFESNAAVTASVIGSDLIVRFPRATDNEVVSYYTIEFLDEDGTVMYANERQSDFFLNSQMPLIYALRYPLMGKNVPTGLQPCKTFQIRVTAVDTYENRSAPIVSERVTVPATFIVEYVRPFERYRKP